MQEVYQINILDFIDLRGENTCKEILSTFSCPPNLNIADFLHNKAITFAKQKISITFLIFQNTPKGIILSGYYTLANKFLSISPNLLSKTLLKRILKFTQYHSSSNQYFLSMPLIAQLGKNYSQTAQEYPISGQELLNLAFQTIQKIQHMIGGKTTYIECDPHPMLIDFYTQNNFISFGKRQKTTNIVYEAPSLIQMLKYFNS